MNPQQPSRPALRDELSGVAAPEAPVAPAPPKVDEPEVRILHHHDTCPGLRGSTNRKGECACAANLELVKDGTYKPLEFIVVVDGNKTIRLAQELKWMEPSFLPAKFDAAELEQLKMKSGPTNVVVHLDGTAEVDGKLQMKRGLAEVTAKLWKVDEGKDIIVERPAPSGSRTAPPIKIPMKLEPRWVCTRCGWAGRSSTPPSHRCDLAAVALATRVATLAEGLTEQQKRSGSLRLVIWKDADDTYHLAEELVTDGKVIKTVERDKDGAYGVLEGALLSAVVDLWS